MPSHWHTIPYATRQENHTTITVAILMPTLGVNRPQNLAHFYNNMLARSYSTVSAIAVIVSKSQGNANPKGVTHMRKLLETLLSWISQD